MSSNIQEWSANIIGLSEDKTKGGEVANCYLILGEKEIAVIDAGFTDKAIENIKEALRIYNRQLPEITTIVMTHSHPDNIGALSFLLKKTKAKFYAHSKSKDAFSDPKNYILSKQFPLDTAAKVSFALKTPIFSGYRDIRQPDVFLEDDQKIPFDGNNLYIRYIGGNSADSIMVYDLKRKSAFIGDEGIIYTNHFDSFFFDAQGNAVARKNFLKLWRNIKADYFLPAHGYPVHGTEAFTFAQNLMIDHERVQNEVFDILAKKGEAKEYLIASELADIFSFKWETPYKDLRVEQTTAKVLLEALEKEGKVTFQEKSQRWKPIET